MVIKFGVQMHVKTEKECPNRYLSLMSSFQHIFQTARKESNFQLRNSAPLCTIKLFNGKWTLFR